MKHIVNLVDITNWEPRINADFIYSNDNIEFSKKRWIEYLWSEANEKIFKNELDKWNISPEERDNILQALNASFWTNKYKFQYLNRNTWWRYFDHLVRVIRYVLSHNPTVTEALMALNHDILEDTDFSFFTLKDLITPQPEVALWVYLISKKPFIDFIDDEDDLILLEKIKKTWILNNKWLLSDTFRFIRDFHPDTLSEEQKNAEEWFIELEEKYKYKRNDEYFSHLLSDSKSNDLFYIDNVTLKSYPSLNRFYNYALSLVTWDTPKLDLWFSFKDKNWNIDNKKIKNICLESLKVKFLDRIDNLRTSEVYFDYNSENIKKANRKIIETKTYFYEIAKEYDLLMWTNFLWLIKNEANKLTTYINDAKRRTFRNYANSIKWKVNDISTGYETYDSWKKWK